MTRLFAIVVVLLVAATSARAEPLCNGAGETVEAAKLKAQAVVDSVACMRDLSGTGFTDREQVKNAHVGTPCQSENTREKVDKQNGIDPSDLPDVRVTYPVFVGDSKTPVTFVTVQAKSAQEWTAVAIGASDTRRFAHIAILRDIKGDNGEVQGEYIVNDMRELQLMLLRRVGPEGQTVLPIRNDARFGFKLGQPLKLTEALQAIRKVSPELVEPASWKGLSPDTDFQNLLKPRVDSQNLRTPKRHIGVDLEVNRAELRPNAIQQRSLPADRTPNRAIRLRSKASTPVQPKRAQTPAEGTQR